MYVYQFYAKRTKSYDFISQYLNPYYLQVCEPYRVEKTGL